MDETDEQSHRAEGPAERPVADPTDLVARLRARLAEHEPEPRRRFDVSGRARDALGRLRPNVTGRFIGRLTGRLTGRRRIELIVGVVAAAIAVAAAIVLLGGTGSPAHGPAAPAATTEAQPTTTSVAAPADRSELLTRVPAAWRPTCRAAQPRTALACAPVAGIHVDVRRVPAASTARTVAQLAEGDAPGPGGAACARDQGGLRTWSTSAHPERVLGHVVCVRSHGDARLVWSVDRDGLVLDATRPDGDIAGLFAWWVASTF